MELSVRTNATFAPNAAILSHISIVFMAATEAEHPTSTVLSYDFLSKSSLALTESFVVSTIIAQINNYI